LSKNLALRMLALAPLLVAVPMAQAQSIEPRSYANAPVGVNFLLAGYAYTSGGVAFDTNLPATDPNLITNSAVLGYARVLDLWGLSGKFDTIVPYTWLNGTAMFAGQPIERSVDGFGDPTFRLSVNLYGAPALTLPEFKSYEQDLIVGVSLQVSAPLGQYDPSKLINLGLNRWSFKPELGLSQALGPWTLELQAAVTLYTDNDEFLGDNTRSQEPLYTLQWHVIREFGHGIWGSLDATYFTGGRTSINDVLNNDLQQNWRFGATLALPVNMNNSIKLYGSSGVAARTGNSFNLLGVLWQYRWGGGF